MPQTRSRGSRRHGSTAPHPSANPADQFALAFGTDDVSNTHRGTDDTPESQNNEGDGSTSPTGNNTALSLDARLAMKLVRLIRNAVRLELVLMAL